MRYLYTLFILFIPFGLAAQDVARAEALVRAFESKTNVENIDLTSTFTLVQKKAGEPDRVLRIRTFRRDAAEQFTLLFQFPDSEKGKGYLRRGDDLYLYLPTTREFVYRNRRDDVGSTDVRTDLFARSDVLGQYNVSYIGQERVSRFETDVIQGEAKTLDVSFPRVKWFLNRANGLPVKVENYSASGTLLRTFFFVDYNEVSPGKFLFTRLIAVNHLENDQRTLLSNDDISSARIPDYTFTQAYLEEQSR